MSIALTGRLKQQRTTLMVRQKWTATVTAPNRGRIWRWKLEAGVTFPSLFSLVVQSANMPGISNGDIAFLAGPPNQDSIL